MERIYRMFNGTDIDLKKIIGISQVWGDSGRFRTFYGFDIFTETEKMRIPATNTGNEENDKTIAEKRRQEFYDVWKEYLKYE